MNQKKVFETLWGGAVGDAIGNPLEFRQLVTDADFLESMQKNTLRISDDTQMTLFEYEGLLKAIPSEQVMLRWWQTQSERPTDAMDGLLQFNSLLRREAPGSTCMGACMALTKGLEVINDSKGNGTVMRCAPFAVYAHLKDLPDEKAYLMAQQDARTTHKHPYAWQSSVLLVAIYLRIFRGEPLQVAVVNAVQALPSCEYVGGIVASMLHNWNYQKLRSTRCGWIAEEALALAVGANLHCEGYLSVIKDACQGVSSDSDTVAGIAGGLAAALGNGAPEELKKKVVASDAIEYIIGLYSKL